MLRVVKDKFCEIFGIGTDHKIKKKITHLKIDFFEEITKQ